MTIAVRIARPEEVPILNAIRTSVVEDHDEMAGRMPDGQLRFVKPRLAAAGAVP